MSGTTTKNPSHMLNCLQSGAKIHSVISGFLNDSRKQEKEIAWKNISTF